MWGWLRVPARASARVAVAGVWRGLRRVLLLLTVQTGRLPWVALTLAVTFGFYGLLRKLAPLGALEGLTLETLLLSPWPWACWAGLPAQGRACPGRAPSASVGVAYRIGPGYGAAAASVCRWGEARATVHHGHLRYIAPSILVLLGVWLYGEPFAGPRALGFVLIWTALAIYTGEGGGYRERYPKQVPDKTAWTAVGRKSGFGPRICLFVCYINGSK